MASQFPQGCARGNATPSKINSPENRNSVYPSKAQPARFFGLLSWVCAVGSAAHTRLRGVSISRAYLRRQVILAGGAFALSVAAGADAAVPLPIMSRLGVYGGAGCNARSGVEAFSDWLGRTPGWVIDFLPHQHGWPEFLAAARWIIGCWRKSGYRLSLAVPLLTAQGDGNLLDGAGGAHDESFDTLAKLLLAADLGDTVIRLGWEFNGDWMPWNAASNATAFVAYWRRAVSVMRASGGPNLRFEWAPSLGRNALDPTVAYPGDDTVDLIGLSVYNQNWSLPHSEVVGRWQYLRKQPNGLDWHRDFAAQRRIPRSFPEWGTGRRPDGSGGGDDPYFIEAMAKWVTAPDVVYFGYWNYSAPDYDAAISTGKYPKAAGALRRHFGAE